MSTKAMLVLCTCPDLSFAENFAEKIVTQKVAKCVSVLPGVKSVYEWENKLEKTAEILLLIKTTEDKYEALEAFILANHPYQVPEIIAMPIVHGYQVYLQWL